MLNVFQHWLKGSPRNMKSVRPPSVTIFLRLILGVLRGRLWPIVPLHVNPSPLADPEGASRAPSQSLPTPGDGNEFTPVCLFWGRGGRDAPWTETPFAWRHPSGQRPSIWTEIPDTQWQPLQRLVSILCFISMQFSVKIIRISIVKLWMCVPFPGQFSSFSCSFRQNLAK